MAYRTSDKFMTSEGKKSSLEGKVYESAVKPVGVHIKSGATAIKVLTSAEVLSESDTKELELVLDNIVNMSPDQAASVNLGADSAGMFEASYDSDEGAFETYNGASLTTADTQTELLILGGENFDGLSEAARSTVYNSITGDGALKGYLNSTSGQKSERDKLAKDSYDEQYRKEAQIRAEKLEDLSADESPMFKKYFDGRGLDYFLLVPGNGPIPEQVLLTNKSLAKLTGKTGQVEVMIKVDHTKDQSQKNKMRLVNNITKMKLKEAYELATAAEKARSQGI